MKIIKRSGIEVDFNINNIINAVKKANNEVDGDEKLTDEQIEDIANEIKEEVLKSNYSLNVEDIQDSVETKIMDRSKFQLARKYIIYRYTHQLLRQQTVFDSKILSIVDCNNEETKQENSNKNPIINSTQRDYIAGEVSKDISRRLLIPNKVMEAHDKGILHFHDSDYFVQYMLNCCLCNLDDMLQNGTVISETMIEKPKSFATACNISTQIIAQVSSGQYGGQSITLAHLAPFVDISRQKIRNKLIRDMESIGEKLTEEQIDSVTELRVRDEVKSGVQTIQYQILTLLTTNGQTPFITIFMCLGEAKDERTKKDLAMIIEEMLKQRIQGVKNEKGVYITPAFPKLIYVLDEDNIHEDSEYFYLTQLAAKCTAKRMVPDYISAKVMRELKEGNVYSSMGCRSFLAPWKDENGEYKFWGRSNLGVVTINLPNAALASGKDINKFWDIFDERLELCHEALLCRYNRLKGTKSDASPILWRYGGLARLGKGEVVDKYLEGGYCSISLGYAGLAECVKYLTGVYHTEEPGTELGLEIMKHMNEKIEEWTEQDNLGYSIYGTPIESCTYKFAKANQKEYGIIEGVTDKNYVTNSYHWPVYKDVDAFTKLKFESQFQELSTGGAISYVEVPDMQNNIDAVITIMQFIYDNIMYAELNTKSDYCMECGFDGEIKIVEDENKKLVWECPNCGNRNQDKMSVARRTCGYIGTQFWNQGRTQEIRDRVLHL